jgi:hypothetical protein
MQKTRVSALCKVTNQLTNPDPNAFFSYKTKPRQQTKTPSLSQTEKETSTMSQNQKSAPGNLQAKLCTS